MRRQPASGHRLGATRPIARRDKMREMQRHMPNAKRVLLDFYGDGIKLLDPKSRLAQLHAFLPNILGASG